METRALTLRLSREDFSRLESEARRARVRLCTLARVVILGYLGERRHDPRRTMERLRRLRAGQTEIDAVALVRTGRAEPAAGPADR